MSKCYKNIVTILTSDFGDVERTVSLLSSVKTYMRDVIRYLILIAYEILRFTLDHVRMQYTYLSVQFCYSMPVLRRKFKWINFIRTRCCSIKDSIVVHTRSTFLFVTPLLMTSHESVMTVPALFYYFRTEIQIEL